MLHYLTPFYFTYVCVEVLSGAIRGTGEALKPMILTCFGICVLRCALDRGCCSHLAGSAFNYNFISFDMGNDQYPLYYLLFQRALVKKE